jgi:hypothetical protein
MNDVRKNYSRAFVLLPWFILFTGAKNIKTKNFSLDKVYRLLYIYQSNWECKKSGRKFVYIKQPSQYIIPK